MRVLLFFLTLNLFSYQAKIIFIDNNFNNLKENSIKKLVYLSSEIAFEIKKGKFFNLYRNIEKDVVDKSGEYIDLNKEGANRPADKKVCVIVLEITSVVDTLIKAVEIKRCNNTKDEILGEFQKSKIGDFIEIETIFDKKNKERMLENRIAEAFASIYMLGIDDDFNYLLESGISEVNKIADEKGDNTVSPIQTDGDENKKKLPRKKKKKKKKKNRKTNFENIRL